MKILWVKAGGLVPPDIGGKIRSYHISTQLARRHEVTLFTFYSAFSDDPHHELGQVFHRSICMPLRIAERGTVGDYLNLARGITSRLPYSVVKYCRPEVTARLQEVLRSDSYDVLVCDFVLPAAIIPEDLPCPLVVFTHNVEAMIWKRHYQLAKNPLWKLVCLQEHRSMERFERRELERADRVLAVSETDRDTFARYLPSSKIDIIPTGVNVEFFLPGEQSDEAPAEIVFTGSMDWMPNEEGILFFLEEVLPLVRKQIPTATLTIAGRNPSQHLQEVAARIDGVQVTGRVADIRPYIRRAAVYVVPLRIGSGTRLKIFEAMAMGKAIVSTTLGAEGLPVTSGLDIVLANDPASFAQSIARLLQDRSERRRLGLAARALVEERYSWRSVASIFEAVLDSVVGRAANRSTIAVG